MNRIFKKSAGVTLLEIMLVLAVAAMIIVMSIRYFQSSQASQQANATMSQIQAITSGMDNLAQGGAGSYTSIVDSDLAAAVGSTNMTTITGDTATISGTSTATTYTISMQLNSKTCAQVAKKLEGNVNIAPDVSACGTGLLSYTYDSTK